jgi:acetylornithine deacetylase
MESQMAATNVEQSLIELVHINSVNPDLDAKGHGEGAVADWVERFCDDHGLEHHRKPVKDQRANVFASLPGTQADRKLLFVAHMDTVPVQKDYAGDPFRAERAGPRLYGRGSCDTKASLAAMLHALALVRKEKHRATIVVAGSADEEHLKLGAKAIARSGVRYDGCVAGEPTSLDVVVAHKGSVRWRVETRGISCHSSMPHLGINAITDMARVITAIEDMAKAFKDHPHPLVGPPTLTISMIEGGIEITTVPDVCRIHIDRRLCPGETPQQALAEVEAVIGRLKQQYPRLNARSLLPAREDPPLDDCSATAIAAAAAEACMKVGKTGTFRGVPYGTDCSQLNSVGIPCVVLGPGSIDQAHTADEFVELEQVHKAVEIYRQIMLNY